MKTLQSINNITAIDPINPEERLRLLQELFNGTKILELDNDDGLTKIMDIIFPNFSATLNNQAQTEITESMINQYWTLQ